MSAERVVESARPFGLVPRREDAVAFAHESQVVLLRHEALAASQEVDYGDVRIRVPRPEDLVLYKLVASRPRDIEDAGKLLALHRTAIDVDRVEALLRQFCEVLEDDHRMETFASLRRRARVG